MRKKRGFVGRSQIRLVRPAIAEIHQGFTVAISSWFQMVMTAFIVMAHGFHLRAAGVSVHRYIYAFRTLTGASAGMRIKLTASAFIMCIGDNEADMENENGRKQLAQGIRGHMCFPAHIRSIPKFLFIIYSIHNKM